MTSWLLQRVTALGILVMLSWHLAVSHFPPRDIDFADVVTRLGQPGWKLFYAVFLALVLYHALNGVWQVAADWAIVQRYRRAVTAALGLVGVAFLALGVQVIVVFDAVAAAGR